MSSFMNNKANDEDEQNETEDNGFLSSEGDHDPDAFDKSGLNILSDSEEEDLFADISDFNEGVGPEVNLTLADVINGYICNPPFGEDLNAKLKKLRRPSNLKIAVPQINPELNSNLSKFGKTRDMALYRVQMTTYKAAVPIIKMMHNIKEKKCFMPTRKELMTTLAESVQLSMAALKLHSYHDGWH